MEEDMPPKGLPKNLTHLSDSLSSCSFRWLGRGLQVLEGRETRQLAPSSLILLPSKSTPILEDLRITTLSLDLMI